MTVTISAVPPRASVDAVLGFAWTADVFTSSDAIEATGLTRSTAIEAIEDLVDRGLLHELENARAAGDYRKGRPARRFELRADAGVVVGLDAGYDRITTIVADLRGDTLARMVRDVDPGEESPEVRRGAILAAARATVAAAPCDPDDVVAICVGVGAPVDSAGASPPHRRGHWERMNPDLRPSLLEWAPIVRIENDAGLAAVAEGSVGAAVGFRDYVVLLADEALGAGVVVDGRLLRGAHGGTGEMVGFDHVRGVDGAYGLGHRIAGWVSDAVSSGELGPEHPLSRKDPETITGGMVLALARGGDPWAQGILERTAALLARVVGTFSSFYDPARVVISGVPAAALDEIVAGAQARVGAELDLPAPEIVASTLGTDVVSIGAVSAARQAARAGILTLERARVLSGL